MKISTTDILRILRLFSRADDTHVPKDTTQLIVKHPRTTNTLGSFLHQGKPYAILFDDVIDDDIEMITDQIKKVHPNVDVSVAVNPLTDSSSHGMPYHGKTCYLAVLDDHTKRLDSYLAEGSRDYSRSSWQQFIKMGYVKVNGAVVSKPKMQVGPHDEIIIDLPPKADYDRQDLPVIYRDENIIVIDKPAGVLTHAKNERDDEFTVESYITRHTDASLSSEERHGIVHRLDRDTSGLIVCALNKTSYHHLKDQFSNRHVSKVYFALTQPAPSEPEAVIDIPIMRSAATPGTFVPNSKGKSAETYYEVIEQHSKRALVKLQPKTGRTHQLRVHLSYIGAPIIGDRLYSKNKKKSSRMFLHATELTFVDTNGTSRHFQSTIPEEFIKELHSDE